MSNPTARPKIRSVVPTVEVEIDGQDITLHYTFAALHEADANPFDGSLNKLLAGLTPDAGAKFLLCGMDDATRKKYDGKLQALLAPNTALEVIGSVARQIEETIEKSSLNLGGGGENPPAA